MRIYSGSLQIDTGKLKDTEQIFIHNTTLENWKVEAVIELFVFITKVQVFWKAKPLAYPHFCRRPEDFPLSRGHLSTVWIYLWTLY